MKKREKEIVSETIYNALPKNARIQSPLGEDMERILTSESATGKKIMDLIKLGFDNSDITPQSGLTLLEDGDLVTEGITELFLKLTGHEKRKVARYPNEFFAKSIEEQIEILSYAFKLNGKETLGYSKKLPELSGILGPDICGYFAYYALPKMSLLMKDLKGGDYNEKYCQLIEMLWEKMLDSRPEHDDTKSTDPAFPYIRQYMNSIELIQKLEAKQPGDMLIIPTQLGEKYAGKTMDQVYAHTMPNEFPLSLYMGLSILLTHPDRLGADSLWDLKLLCPGDYLLADDHPFDPEQILGLETRKGDKAETTMIGLASEFLKVETTYYNSGASTFLLL